MLSHSLWHSFQHQADCDKSSEALRGDEQTREFLTGIGVASQVKLRGNEDFVTLAQMWQRWQCK